jgi:undecaprenyl-diphosphatase
VLLTLFLVMAVVVKLHSGPLPGDVGLTLHLQQWLRPHRTVTDAIVMVSTVAWPIPSIITIAVLGVLLLAMRRWLDVIAILLVTGLANGTNYLISMAVHRPRPSDHGLYIAEHVKTTYSFPSGHVLQGVVFFGFLLFLTFQVRREYAWMWVIRIALLVFILSMGPSRLLEGEHWPSDVLGASILGLFWLVAAACAYRWAALRWPKLRGRAGPLPGSAPAM